MPSVMIKFFCMIVVELQTKKQCQSSLESEIRDLRTEFAFLDKTKINQHSYV